MNFWRASQSEIKRKESQMRDGDFSLGYFNISTNILDSVTPLRGMWAMWFAYNANQMQKNVSISSHSSLKNLAILCGLQFHFIDFNIWLLIYVLRSAFCKLDFLCLEFYAYLMAVFSVCDSFFFGYSATGFGTWKHFRR